MAALLTSEISDSDKLNILIKDCRKSGLEILPPDINCSNYEFTIEDNKLRFGLGGIKHMGQKVCEAIANERINGPYISFRDFLKRTRKDTSRKAYEVLIKAGALDTIVADRTFLLSQLENELERMGSERLQYLERQNSLFNETEPTTTDTDNNDTHAKVNSTTKDQTLTYEKEAVGFYFSCHPLENFAVELGALNLTPISRLDSMANQNMISGNTQNNRFRNLVQLGGVVISRQQKKDRKGQDYAVFNLEDFSGITEIIAFSDVYARSRQFLRPDVPIIVKGRMSSRDEIKTQIEARDIIPFTEWQNYFDNLLIVMSADVFSEKITEVKNLLEKYSGPKPIYFKVKNPDQTSSIYHQNEPGVSFSKELISDLNDLIGKDAVKIVRQDRPQY
jgi:DNA polymerase-3 subunit alpha